MPRFRLKKGIKIGALAAENDSILERVFVDAGYIEPLLDPNDPTFLVLGRTGSGKTALIERVKQRAEHVSRLHPDELSMQYLQNSSILRTLAGWGVNLEIFYKYLWRHVCILELIRMRYGDSIDVPNAIQQIFPINQLFKSAKARELSQQYLRDYGDDYWIKTDTRIKNITTEVEYKLRKDPRIAAALGGEGAKLEASFGRTKEDDYTETVESEVVERAQNIVSDFQIAALNRVVELLSQYGFEDEQRAYYLVIDDLDKNWMPDDRLYLELLKSLLSSVHELNRRLRGVKIIVALRENIYYRVFRKGEQHEPQREKWADVQLKIRWSHERLVEMVNSRLAEVLRGEYTQQAPIFQDLLPDRKRKTQEDAIDYIFSRTFMRPRDVIDFVNTCFDQAEISNFTWAHITKAEAEYSHRRLDSVFDEWKDSFFGLPLTFPLFRKLGVKFRLADINDDDLLGVLIDARADKCSWLSSLRERVLSDRASMEDARIELVKALFIAGIVGIKAGDGAGTIFSFERTFNFLPENVVSATFVVHKMFWHALNVFDYASASAHA